MGTREFMYCVLLRCRRGKVAASEVVIETDNRCWDSLDPLEFPLTSPVFMHFSSVSIHGVLRDGRTYEFYIQDPKSSARVPAKFDDADPFVGRETIRQSLTHTHFVTQSYFISCVHSVVSAVGGLKLAFPHVTLRNQSKIACTCKRAQKVAYLFLLPRFVLCKSYFSLN